MNEVGCKGFASSLFGLMAWDDDTKYKFRGRFFDREDGKLLLFELDEPEMLKTVEQVVPIPLAEGAAGTTDETTKEEIVVRETVRMLPPSWLTTFGDPVISIGSVNLLYRVAVDSEWDVLRPAKEVEELNTLTSNQLSALMKEAEEIMVGWDKKMEGSNENGQA